MIAVTGLRTTIIQELSGLVPAGERIQRLHAFDLDRFDATFIYPPDVTRFVLAAGVLWQKRIAEQTAQEITSSLAVNLINVVRFCESIFDTLPTARVVIIGSESGLFGSHDLTYALAKCGLQSYVEWKRVGREQLLGLVNPPIIANSGMTWGRSDYPQVLKRRRHVSAKDVAVIVARMLFDYGPGLYRERVC